MKIWLLYLLLQVAGSLKLPNQLMEDFTSFANYLFDQGI